MRVSFQELDFTEAPENVAIQDLLDFAEPLQDNAGNELFADVNFGWEKPEGTPTAEQVPMLRIWSDSGTEDMDNNCDLMNDGRRLLSLYFYFYDFADETGDNIQAQRARFIRHFLSHLSDPAVQAAFHANAWRIDFDTKIQIDHTNALKRINDYIVVNPPWYVTRVDIPIEVFTEFAE